MNRLVGFAGVVAACSLAAVAHAQPPQFVLEWGQFGTAIESFNEPYALTVDASGNVYVSDTVNNRIQKFDADGNFIRTWGGLGLAAGQFRDPVGLTTDAAGNIYVAEFTGDRVQKFDADGNFITKWGSTGSGPGQFRTADDVCVDPSGDVFVADKNNHRIQKFTAGGSFLLEWGAFGTAPGQFQHPVGVKCDAAGNVYVVEQSGNRMQKFTASGTYITMWGTPGAGPGQFNEPVHLDIDAADRIYVPDSKNHRIQVFETDGTFVVAWGTQGTGEGEFQEPEGVAVGPDGSVYVADTQNHRVQKFFGTDTACGACPPLPAADTARFHFGAVVPAGGAFFDVPLQVDTAENVTFSQMTVEFDAACVQFVSASVGSDVANAGGIFVNEGAGASDPALDRHVLVNVTGEYGARCDSEVFVLRFESLVGPASACRIAWDRSAPAGNPPNHLNTTESVQIRSPALRFCDLDGFDTRTTFRFGSPTPIAGGLEVPLLVTTHEAITFTQMTVEYDGACATFLGASMGSGVTNPGSPFILDTTGATDPLLDRHVSINATGQYGPGTDIEVFRLQFGFAGGVPSPCRLVWDRATPAGNAPNHLITGVPSVIRPDVIHFIDGAIASTCPDIHVSGRITYFGNGADVEAAIPDATSQAVTVANCAVPSQNDAAGDGSYDLALGSGPLAQVCICATRPKADCEGAEGGVISGNDLIRMQDFIAQIGPSPTERERLAADLNGDGNLLANDAMALKQWIGHAAVCATDKCLGNATDNCAGTWRFVFPHGPNPGDFTTDERCLNGVCGDHEVNAEGILLGDVDASWPNVFPGPLAAKSESARTWYLAASVSLARRLARISRSSTPRTIPACCRSRCCRRVSITRGCAPRRR